jgi:MerR family transcriptional regulator, redox-sensitive transcriptional activator SoxR
VEKLQLKANFKASKIVPNEIEKSAELLRYDSGMAGLTISEVARRIGVQASTIRYYEQIGLLPPAPRESGQRRYDATILYRLAIIRRARQLDFTLQEIRQLFFGFGSVRASARWQKLCLGKLAELQTLAENVKSVQHLLRRMMRRCRCETLDQCGRGILRNGFPPGMPKRRVR